MKGLSPLILVASMLLLPASSRCAMIVRDYAPVRNDRFYSGSGKNFVGDPYDFSGVGFGSTGRWATLVTDTCFLSAVHRHPAVGEQVTFWATNDLAGSSHTYTVSGGTRVGSTDLWLGWFDSAVDASIAHYPVPMLRSGKAYPGLVLFNYGMSHRVGRNVLETLAKSQLGNSTGIIAIYDYDDNDNPSAGSDETYFQVGDSGAPSFAVFNSRLALIGIHWSITHNPDSSTDTFVPAYFDEINKILKKRGQSLRRSRWRQKR